LVPARTISSSPIFAASSDGPLAFSSIAPNFWQDELDATGCPCNLWHCVFGPYIVKESSQHVLVVVRDSLALPWRDLRWALRRREDRGVLRGGRFVGGFSGEQHALPEAVER
jgi:hypothetical protein